MDKRPCQCVSTPACLIKTVMISVLQSRTLTSAFACHKGPTLIDVKVWDGVKTGTHHFFARHGITVTTSAVINSERVFSSAAFADSRSPRKVVGDTTICLYADVVHLRSTNI